MTVEELIAREEIRQCLYRHFRAADRLDLELERAAFWEDGHFVGGPIEGPMAEQAAPLIEQLLPGAFDRVMHYIANLLITVDGDDARAELYGIGYHVIRDDPAIVESVVGAASFATLDHAPGGRVELWIGVRYAVVMQRRGGEWRILTMQPIIEWSRVQPYAGILAGGVTAGMPTPPCRDRTDASYFGGDWRP